MLLRDLISDNCAGAPCSDICVNDDVVAAGYTCLCREEFKLDTDGSTCIGMYSWLLAFPVSFSVS